MMTGGAEDTGGRGYCSCLEVRVKDDEGVVGVRLRAV